jgi:replicative DNA helicase
VIAFEFSSEFQRKIVKLALTDDGFATMGLKYLTAEMFESDALRWVWKQVQIERDAGRRATMMVVQDRLRDVDAVLRPRYQAVVTAIDQDVMREEAFVKERLAEFIKRNLFVAAYNDSQNIYNSGRPEQAMQAMYEASQSIQQVTFDAPDRSWFYDEFEERQRIFRDHGAHEFDSTFATGIDGVDKVLDGGLSRGELGVWIADSKGGKSMLLRFLAAHTCRALQRNVLLIILEGRRLQTEAQLDTLHAGILYKDMKRGVVDRDTYRQLQTEYRALRQRLVVRAMVKDWTYTAADIRSELDELRALHGWVPDMIIVDYGDLLRSQTKAFSEEEHQRNAFGDLKSLSTQDNGYAVWTASQAQRPSKEMWKKKKKEAEEEGEDTDDYKAWGKPMIRARDIADSYNKIRRADFIGSINQDEKERQEHIARLWCDRYRDNEAARLVLVRQKLHRMMFADLLDPLNRPDMADKVRVDIEEGLKGKASNG